MAGLNDLAEIGKQGMLLSQNYCPVSAWAAP